MSSPSRAQRNTVRLLYTTGRADRHHAAARSTADWREYRARTGYTVTVAQAVAISGAAVAPITAGTAL